MLQEESVQLTVSLRGDVKAYFWPSCGMALSTSIKISGIGNKSEMQAHPAVMWLMAKTWETRQREKKAVRWRSGGCALAAVKPGAPVRVAA